MVGTLELDALADEILARLVEATSARGAALWVARDGGELALQRRRGSVGREAVAFPLLAGVETVGLVHLQPADRPWTPQERAAAATLAAAAAVALRTSLRCEALRAETLRDDRCGAYRLAYLADQASRELDRGRRYGRRTSLAAVAVEAIGAAGAEHLAGAAEEIDRAVVAAIARVVREADVLARAGPGEFRLLLPETDRFGALRMLRRAGEELRAHPALLRAPAPGLRLALGAATAPVDGDAPPALEEACRARQEEYRASPLHALPRSGADLGFWELVDALLDRTPPGAASAVTRSGSALVDAIQAEVGREIGRTARARGVAYVAAPTEAAARALVTALPRLEAADRAGDLASRVHLLCPRGDGAAGAAGEHPLVRRVAVEPDRRLERRPFLLFLSERTAYAALGGVDGPLFHTADTPLVDLLVARLQALHDLQPAEAA